MLKVKVKIKESLVGRKFKYSDSPMTWIYEKEETYDGMLYIHWKGLINEYGCRENWSGVELITKEFENISCGKYIEVID